MDNHKSMKLEIITPDEITFTGEANFVKARAIDGEIGVLPNHAPMVVALDVAELRIDRDGEPPCHVAVFGGFLEVKNNQVDVITPNCELPESIDVERAHRSRLRAEERLKSKDPAIDERRAKLSLARALLRIHITETSDRVNE